MTIRLLQDFQIKDIPQSLQWVHDWGPVLLIADVLLFGVGCAFVFIGAISVLRGGGWPIHTSTIWLRDSIIWRLPAVGAMARDRGMADICGVLADATGSGLPLPTALRDCEHLRVNRILARRLRRMAEAIERGATASRAAHDARLPALLSAALTQADAPTALRFMQQHYQSRFNRLSEWLAATIGPAMTLAMGLAIGWLVIAFYLPFVQIVHAAAFGPASHGLPGALP